MIDTLWATKRLNISWFRCDWYLPVEDDTSYYLAVPFAPNSAPLGLQQRSAMLFVALKCAMLEGKHLDIDVLCHCWYLPQDDVTLKEVISLIGGLRFWFLIKVSRWHGTVDDLVPVPPRCGANSSVVRTPSRLDAPCRLSFCCAPCCLQRPSIACVEHGVSRWNFGWKKATGCSTLSGIHTAKYQWFWSIYCFGSFGVRNYVLPLYTILQRNTTRVEFPW